MIGDEKMTLYHNAYYYHEQFATNSTADGRFKEVVSRLTFKPFSWPYRQKVV